MERTVLKATRRTQFGTKHARREREAGRLLAVIYGHGEEPVVISLDAHETLLELQHGARVLSLELGEGTVSFLIKEVQYDYLGTNPIHIDLMRVDVSEKVTVKIAIELRGIAAGIADNGVLENPLNEIEIECLLTDIPDNIPVSVKHLGVGDVLLVKDLKLDERVASVRVLAEEVVPEDEQGEGSALPEVIGRAKEEEGAAESS